MRSYSLLVSLLLFVSGCSSSRFAPVSGRVTLGDQPLAHATVIFQPLSENPNPGPGSQGKTDANGLYTLQLLTGEGKGALIGLHKVSIVAYEGGGDEVPSSGSDIVFRKALIPDEYNTNSVLRFEVPATGTTKANFEIPATGTK